VVEERDADVQRRLDGRVGLGDVGLGERAAAPVAAQGHAAVDERADVDEMGVQGQGRVMVRRWRWGRVVGEWRERRPSSSVATRDGQKAAT
jgi:hypothetical protein